MLINKSIAAGLIKGNIYKQDCLNLPLQCVFSAKICLKNKTIYRFIPATILPLTTRTVAVSPAQLVLEHIMPPYTKQPCCY